MLTIARRPTDDVQWWVVQTRAAELWRTYIIHGELSEVAMTTFAGPAAAVPEVLALTPVGRTGAAGSPVAIRLR